MYKLKIEDVEKEYSSFEEKELLTQTEQQTKDSLKSLIEQSKAIIFSDNYEDLMKDLEQDSQKLTSEELTNNIKKNINHIDIIGQKLHERGFLTAGLREKLAQKLPIEINNSYSILDYLQKKEKGA